MLGFKIPCLCIFGLRWGCAAGVSDCRFGVQTPGKVCQVFQGFLSASM